MSKYPPYIIRDAGDVASGDDWNRLQNMIREEVRQHRHMGETHDTNRLEQLGRKLDNESFEEGVVDEAALASGAVTARVLQDELLADWAIAEDAQILENENLYFDVDTGHKHDGENSSLLAKASVGTRQIVDKAVTEDKLEQKLLDEIADMERLLAIPQALFISSAAGSGPGSSSYATIVGHGFGETPGVVKLLKPSGGQYVAETADVPVVEDPDDWSNNSIRVRLPAEPTGLMVVEVDGIPLNPLKFDEALVVTDSEPEHRKLDVSVDVGLEIGLSTEILHIPGPDPNDDPVLRVLYPGSNVPQDLDQELDADGNPPDSPIEIYYGTDATRLHATLSLSKDRKTVMLTSDLAQLPWDTVFVIKIYGSADAGDKPVLLAANNESPIDGKPPEIRFTTREAPPAKPASLKIVSVVGKGGKVVSPENIISLANHHAIPIEIVTDSANLPSDWIEIEATDGARSVTDRIPAIGGGATVYITLDVRELADGLVQISARARNATNQSDWVVLQSNDPHTAKLTDGVFKDTARPFLRVHPVRSPTRFDRQEIVVDVEPGSTVTVHGGLGQISVRDKEFSGRITINVPLNSNATSYLRLHAFDTAGNRSLDIHADRNGRTLAIVHDDKLPEIKVNPVTSPTRQRRITIVGTANEPVSVVATSGGRIATGRADLSTPFRIPFDLQRNSVNRIRLVATDSAGNTSPPVSVAIRHDDQPPFIRLYRRWDHVQLNGASTSKPFIVVRRTRVHISGWTEPGSTVILSGYGHRRTTRARASGWFTISVPFRLTPNSFHHRYERKRWHFRLDAYDLSGNRTNQQKEITIELQYRHPSNWYRHWHRKGSYWYNNYQRRYPYWRNRFWFVVRGGEYIICYHHSHWYRTSHGGRTRTHWHRHSHWHNISWWLWWI